MASKRRIRRYACGRKKRYDTIQAAKAAISALRHFTPGGFLKPYKCKFCGFFHFGHAVKVV